MSTTMQKYLPICFDQLFKIPQYIDADLSENIFQIYCMLYIYCESNTKHGIVPNVVLVITLYTKPHIKLPRLPYGNLSAIKKACVLQEPATVLFICT